MEVDFSATVRARGPAFDGRAARAMRAYTDQVARDVTRHAENLVHQRLRRVLRHPTGYYQAQVTTERAASGRWVVTDRGVIYGPWLEGTGSRNYPVTRFRGYATFRRVRAQVAADAHNIASGILRQYIGRL